MEEHVRRIDMGDVFRVCPECGYEDGFHSMFKKDGDTRKWLFICPNCHAVFDVGLTV